MTDDLNAQQQTTADLWDDLSNGRGFPEPTPETRAELGCWAKTPGDLTACWCGYHVVDGLGCCPQCVGRSA